VPSARCGHASHRIKIKHSYIRASLHRGTPPSRLVTSSGEPVCFCLPTDVGKGTRSSAYAASRHYRPRWSVVKGASSGSARPLVRPLKPKAVDITRRPAPSVLGAQAKDCDRAQAL
jgi:hypothetical protein